MVAGKQSERRPDRRRPGHLEAVRTLLKMAQTVLLIVRMFGGW